MDQIPIALDEPGRFHIVGIGGAGMSAIATVLVEMGHRVSGSDQAESAVLDRLRNSGVAVAVGHAAQNLTQDATDRPTAVAHSTAIDLANPELAAAVELGIPVLTRADILSAIARLRRTIAVSGTHGKTTTSAMLVSVLSGAGLDPAFIVGGELRQLGAASWGSGDWFAVEADESDGTFTELGAEMAVVTNVAADHLDFYGDLEGIERAFDRFLAEAPGPNLVCADDPLASALGARHRALSYGTASGADFVISEPESSRGASSFVLQRRGPDGSSQRLGTVQLPIAGLHNIRNATAAIAVGMSLGVSFETASEALAAYPGVARRFEVRGERKGVTVVDDYAHNPGKISAVLEAAAQSGWSRVIAVFQPHRYSRTQDLAAEFGRSFDQADVVVITDIYAAGEMPRPGVSAKLVVDSILDQRPRSRVIWLPQRADVIRFLAGELRSDDLCLTLGAGDITNYGPQILGAL